MLEPAIKRMIESSMVPFEALKTLVANLNKLFSTLLSFQDEFPVRGLEVEVGRQMTLDQKTVLATTVTVALEPQYIAEWKELEELIEALSKEGFKASYPKEVEGLPATNPSYGVGVNPRLRLCHYQADRYVPANIILRNT